VWVVVIATPTLQVLQSTGQFVLKISFRNPVQSSGSDPHPSGSGISLQVMAAVVVVRVVRVADVVELVT
jgi:hypothetical protein